MTLPVSEQRFAARLRMSVVQVAASLRQHATSGDRDLGIDTLQVEIM